MIGNKLEQSIISVFQYNLSQTFSINELAKKLHKSYPMINQKSNFFLKEGILRKINIGRSYQCFLNLNNDKARILMSINEVNTRESFIEKNKDFQVVMEELSKTYSNNRNTDIITIIFTKSDIIFVLKELETKLITSIQGSLLLPSKYKLSFFSIDLFKEDIINNYSLQKDHVILFNIEKYIEILSLINDRLLVKGMLESSKSTEGKK